ncbi:hypothetical protein I4F81_007207 [Pyropia yezoensis]|uniref:Uncharacterized protein n=1 Tax=Pyropia yezoensis TaxID=2788 RepID=A0ACC3C4E3_PYRYE|nr:hypothetical protein I4F81_007207 [Neopyropia yezoensis]
MGGAGVLFPVTLIPLWSRAGAPVVVARLVLCRSSRLWRRPVSDAGRPHGWPARLMGGGRQPALAGESDDCVTCAGWGGRPRCGVLSRFTPPAWPGGLLGRVVTTVVLWDADAGRKRGAPGDRR